jgi:hypothetical protein
MIKYLVVHNKHEGCYDFKCYQDDVARIRLTSITINPPKIFMFTSREEAQDFFEEYINDIDCIDIRCKRGDDVEHMDYCSCGVIELDDKGEPVLFYNKKNQIFLLENSPQLFVPNQDTKNDIRNFNLTNKLIRKCKSLGREQRKRYIELGKYCEECNLDTDNEEDSEKKNELLAPIPVQIIIQPKVPEQPKEPENPTPTPNQTQTQDQTEAKKPKVVRKKKTADEGATPETNKEEKKPRKKAVKKNPDNAEN